MTYGCKDTLSRAYARAAVADGLACPGAWLSGRTNTVFATIPVGHFPRAAAVNPKTDTIYVTNLNRSGALRPSY